MMSESSDKIRLANGWPISASEMIDTETTVLADDIMQEFTAVLNNITYGELRSFPQMTGRKPKPSLGGVDPHLSTETGWDPVTKTGLRFPNPSYPKQISPTIAYQNSEMHLATSTATDERLEGLRRKCTALGDRVLRAARLFPPLERYAEHFVTHETRVNANLAGKKSPLWPQVTPRGFLHAPHNDRSVATVGINATSEGFGYYNFEEKRFMHDVPPNYLFLGEANGAGDKACLHAVEETDASLSGLKLPDTPFGIGRLSLVVFFQGKDFIDLSTSRSLK